MNASTDDSSRSSRGTTEPPVPTATGGEAASTDPGDRQASPPPEVPPQPSAQFARPAPAADGLLTRLGIGLIGAASLLILSVFLPWSTWQDDFSQKLQTTTHIDYGVETSVGYIVTLSGMAALTLALMIRAVSRRFAGYAAIPGGLALIATFQEGVTGARENTVLNPSIAWGYWTAVAAAVAVVGLSLAIFLRRPNQS